MRPILPNRTADMNPTKDAMPDHQRPHDPDTDTLTLVDEIADRETIKQFAVDPDAPTHRLEPRVFAPLRVCPACSRAWEVTGDWCPSCGTAFDVDDSPTVRTPRVRATVVRPGRTGEVRAARRGSAAPRVNAAGSSGNGRSGGRASTTAATPEKSGGGALKVVATVLAFSLAIVFAFVLGQETRASKEEVDQRIEEAVQQTKDSAVASFQREFEQQRDRLQAEFNERVKTAEAQAREQGRADAEADGPGGVLDNVERCLKNFLLDC